MDTHGKEYIVACNENGNFTDPEDSWPTCREAQNCTGEIPIPDASSKMENATTDLAVLKEFDEVVYKCKDSSHVVGKKLGKSQILYTQNQY